MIDRPRNPDLLPTKDALLWRGRSPRPLASRLAEPLLLAAVLFGAWTWLTAGDDDVHEAVVVGVALEDVVHALGPPDLLVPATSTRPMEIRYATSRGLAFRWGDVVDGVVVDAGLRGFLP